MTNSTGEMKIDVGNRENAHVETTYVLDICELLWLPVSVCSNGTHPSPRSMSINFECAPKTSLEAHNSPHKRMCQHIKWTACCNDTPSFRTEVKSTLQKGASFYMRLGLLLRREP